MMLDVLSNIEQKSKAEKNTSDEVVNSVSRNPAQTKYENDVDAVINGTYKSDSELIMGVTPQIYQDLSFSKLPIAITKNHVYSIAVTEQQAKADGRYKNNVNYHGLGNQAVKDIYQNISDPIMIIASPDFQSKVQRESMHKVIAIVDLQVDGKQVIAPIEIDAEVENNNYERIDVNLFFTYFDKNNLSKMLSEAVAQESTGNVGFYYVDKNRAEDIFKKSKVQYLSRLDSFNSNGIIHTIDEKINRKIDSVLKSQQFIRWFGDWQNHPERASKIVNADGTPKVMYHGTQSSFTAFDKKKAKSYGYYGKGFYFTDSESHAQQYGNSMAVYLDVKNPLEQGKNSISKKQLRKFLEAVAENEDYDIWNYGTENIFEIVDSIYKNDAFSVIQDVNATAIGDFAEAIALFNMVNKTSYDGNVIPLSQRFDDSKNDIRFSKKRYWTPDMPKSDFEHIKHVAKNELYKTDDYLDNITKWLYNSKNGKTYFALYSTEVESEPTILYASIDDQAVTEHSLVMSYLDELGDESDDGKAKTFNEILEMLENTANLRVIHRGLSSNRRNGNGDVSVYSRSSSGGLSRALRNCLQDSYERRRSVEKKQESTKRQSSVSEEASNYILDSKEYREIIISLTNDTNSQIKRSFHRRRLTDLQEIFLQKQRANMTKSN